jgi:hypothetical protein
VKFAPNVTRVEVLSREPLDDGREKVAIRVYAKAIFPAAVRTIFNISDMDWKETYIVDLKKNTVDWKVETPMFTEYVECGGVSSARAVPGGCEMAATGTMKIKIPPMKGIPEPVVRSVIGIIEPFIGNMVTMNLKKVFKSVKAIMEKETAEAGRKKASPGK